MTDLTILRAYRDDGDLEHKMWAIYIDGVQLWWEDEIKVEQDAEIMRAIRANLPITSCRFLSFESSPNGISEGDPWFADNDPPDNLSDIPPEVMARAEDWAAPSK